MTDPAASLENLRDIVEPAPPPSWPPAPGVWVALVIVVAVVLSVVLAWRRARSRNAYRRAGLVLLSDARTVHDVQVILKRVALAVFPRREVASLYGDPWSAFLDGTCSRTRFVALGVPEPDDEASPALRAAARSWIRHHRVSTSGSSEGGS